MDEVKLPRVVMISLWRDDELRRLYERTQHLLSKSYANLRWMWLVGDSSDATESMLRNIAWQSGRDAEIVRADTGIVGEDPTTRVRRLSVTVNAGFERVRESDEYVLIHESDLISPTDLVERFLETGKCPIAGWPVLPLDTASLFYDTWAYRRNGVRFTNDAPHHACYRPDECFEVDSVGSVWMMHAEDLRAGVRAERLACVELCEKLRARGRRIWVDPRVQIIQSIDLWTCWSHAA
jgi:hypothetical protein